MARNRKPVMSPYIQQMLDQLCDEPMPRQEINCGAHGRMVEMGWVREVKLPSPYKCHYGACIVFFEITKLGVAALKLAKETA